MWFKDLVGFDEISPENVRDNITVIEDHIISKVNGKSFRFGKLEIPTLKELKNQSPPREIYKEKLKIQEVIGNVQDIHRDPLNKNALFQAASQFNLLEMVAPHITPERGVGIYERDYTQGPACAIACGAGTIYRDYFVPINDNIGQSANQQIDCLKLIGDELNNKELKLWQMNNGYALVNQEGLFYINSLIKSLKENKREELKEKLKFGIQWNTEVIISNPEQVVSQIYCSALPVAYSDIKPTYWETFARLILEATYEATLYTALINYDKTGCNKVFLTLVGGGAFGNKTNWITESILSAILKFRNTPLDVKIISYGKSSKDVTKLIKQYK
ncbi:MAG: hypothetical protein N4A72_17075 [Bacteroidales bacterium]|jgi:hypothetical protein|nr:hypothetical protein [Bacteroidales bacterium]